MQRYNKKGLSEVVTAIIVILLVLVAIGIIWAVVRNLLDQGATEAQGGVACLTTQVTISSASKVPPTGTTTSYNVVLMRDTGGASTPITSVKLVFSDGSTSATVDQTVNLAELGTQTVSVLVGSVVGVSNPTTVAVAPVIDGKTCNPSAATTIA